MFDDMLADVVAALYRRTPLPRKGVTSPALEHGDDASKCGG